MIMYGTWNPKWQLVSSSLSPDEQRVAADRVEVMKTTQPSC